MLSGIRPTGPNIENALCDWLQTESVCNKSHILMVCSTSLGCCRDEWTYIWLLLIAPDLWKLSKVSDHWLPLAWPITEVLPWKHLSTLLPRTRCLVFLSLMWPQPDSGDRYWRYWMLEELLWPVSPEGPYHKTPSEVSERNLKISFLFFVQSLSSSLFIIKIPPCLC